MEYIDIFKEYQKLLDLFGMNKFIENMTLLLTPAFERYIHKCTCQNCKSDTSVSFDKIKKCQYYQLQQVKEVVPMKVNKIIPKVQKVASRPVVVKSLTASQQKYQQTVKAKDKRMARGGSCGCNSG